MARASLLLPTNGVGGEQVRRRRRADVPGSPGLAGQAGRRLGGRRRRPLGSRGGSGADSVSTPAAGAAPWAPAATPRRRCPWSPERRRAQPNLESKCASSREGAKTPAPETSGPRPLAPEPGPAREGRVGDGRLPPVTPSPPPRGRLGFPAPPRVPARTRLPAPLPPAGAQVSPSICFSRLFLSPGLPCTPRRTLPHVGFFGSRAPNPELQRHAEPSRTSAPRLPRSRPPGTPPRAPNAVGLPPSPALGAVCPSLQLLHPGPFPSSHAPVACDRLAFAPRVPRSCGSCPPPSGQCAPRSSRRILAVHPSRFPSPELPRLPSCAAASLSPCQELKRSCGTPPPQAVLVSLPTAGAASLSPRFPLPGKRGVERRGRDLAACWLSATNREREQWRRRGGRGRSGRSK
ncbi:nascent polypeptide-associated complex subunit alpha, muscle-specific form-like [Mirounga leonina]|uniref:nascent polypeptide-associated complex subunit alpha, muscle-specific form-like n=1 Tax=Mirounga leonina TaxID=9715 RepID=UPI00156C35F4|nr:nascent polypeptide-associated complex subunit alpha, muscle-specific form-like [Mirounga leonina]